MTLVPSNHRLKEHALAAVLDQLRLDPSAMETLWDAWRCPSGFLPFLAWSLSVDRWDDAADEVSQRLAIAQSPAYHRRKGSALSVDEAAASAGRVVSIFEWWQFSPERRRGTFEIQIPLGDEEDTEALAAAVIKIRSAVRAAKPKSRAFSLTLTKNIPVTIQPSVGLIPVSRVRLDTPPDTMDAFIGLSANISTVETITLGGI